MIQIKTKHKGNQLIIRHKLNQNEQVAYLEQSLIEQGEIPDLIPVSVQNQTSGAVDAIRTGRLCSTAGISGSRDLTGTVLSLFTGNHSYYTGL